MHRRHRVVIVGAGFGGLAAARALRDTPVDVVVIDARNYHTFQPLLYQVATAGLDADDISAAVRGIFQRQRNVDFLYGRVTGVDLDARRVHVAGRPDVGYDHLILAAGAVTATYGVDGVVDHAIGLKDMDDALAIRAELLRRFEDASAAGADGERGSLTVAVVGGGPTGVELAGGLAELFTKVLVKDYPDLDVRRARVVLVEMGDRLLPSFAPSLSEKARRTLAGRGVEIVLGVGVRRVEPDAVVLEDDRRIPAAVVVWAAGVQASPLAGALGDGVARAAAGRLVVGDDLGLPGHPEVFAVGDIAAAHSGGGDRPLPQVAPPAIQGGRHAAAMIGRRLAGRPTQPFRYHDKGSMATIGRNHAVAALPWGLKLSGFVGWVAWLGLHLVYLVGFRNRVNVLVNWAWNYLTYDRASRTIPGSR